MTSTPVDACLKNRFACTDESCSFFARCLSSGVSAIVAVVHTVAITRSRRVKSLLFALTVALSGFTCGISCARSCPAMATTVSAMPIVLESLSI
jgi:hypothetical protein